MLSLLRDSIRLSDLTDAIPCRDSIRLSDLTDAIPFPDSIRLNTAVKERLP